MFKWLMMFCPSERRRRRQLAKQLWYLRDTLQHLLYNQQLEPSTYFLCRLREYSRETFTPLIRAWHWRRVQIVGHEYSRKRDRGRAQQSARFLFLEAVRDAL